MVMALNVDILISYDCYYRDMSVCGIENLWLLYMLLVPLSWTGFHGYVVFIVDFLYLPFAFFMRLWPIRMMGDATMEQDTLGMKDFFVEEWWRIFFEFDWWFSRFFK